MKATRYLLTATLLAMTMACSESFTVEPFEYPKAFTGDDKKAWAIRTFQVLKVGLGTIGLRVNDCDLDDKYVFYNNPERSYQVTTGASKCTSGEESVRVDGSWSFVNASATLTIVVPFLSDNPLPFTVKEVDNAKMVLDIYLDENTNYRVNFKPVSVE